MYKFKYTHHCTLCRHVVFLVKQATVPEAAARLLNGCFRFSGENYDEEISVSKIVKRYTTVRQLSVIAIEVSIEEYCYFVKRYAIVRLLKAVYTLLPSRTSRTLSRLLWEASRHAAINVGIIFAHKYPPLSIDRYSFIEMSELEQLH